MFWKLILPALLAWTLCSSTRPRGSIPSPYKLTKDKQLSSSPAVSPAGQKGRQEVLSSSREALVVTERKYLKSDWCKTQPLRQTLSLEGCVSRTFINRFCYGQCNSFYIPRHLTSRKTSNHHHNQHHHHNHQQEEEAAFQSCSFCRPHRVTTVTVRLHCPGLRPAFRHRKVQRVKQCRCVSVNVNED